MKAIELAGKDQYGVSVAILGITGNMVRTDKGLYHVTKLNIKNNMKEIKKRLERIEHLLMAIERRSGNENNPFNEEYADINGIFLKRKNESLKYGRWHFTLDEVKNHVKTRGLRLPSKEEWVRIFELGSTWDEEKKGRWIGKNHSQKQETACSTFLPAAGFRTSTGTSGNVGSYGHYWSSTAASSGAFYLDFNSSMISPEEDNYRVFGFSVRCLING
jgi:uncharacterized protein (TIGR02145 family)